MKYAITAAAIALVAAIFVLVYLCRPPETFQEAAGCPQEPGYTKTSVFILLDTTDRISPTQKDHIQDTVNAVVGAVAPYSRIRIFEILPSRQRLLEPDFDSCKPDADNPLGSPVVQREEKRRFEESLESYFKGIRFDRGRPTSPIIHAIGSVATYFADSEGEISLIIASDFIENSRLLNQYSADWRATADGTAARQLRASAPRLNGANLSMLVIPRPDIPHHDDKFIDWWGWYLLNVSGASIELIEFHNERTGETYSLPLHEWITE